MKRFVFLNGVKTEYDLQIKKVKYINLRVKSDGSIKVSANKHTPVAMVDDFVVSKAVFILNAMEKYKNMPLQTKVQYFTEAEVKQLILELCQKAYPYYAEKGIGCPQIKFRKMVSQWGNCRAKQGILTFNTNLMYAPSKCVEYVVWHEFTHFLQQNHSAKFYAELEKVCPDWKTCRKKLKEINIR